MRLLVTGATGIIGRQVVSAAVADGVCDIVAVGRRHVAMPATRFREADLSNAASAEALVRDVAPTHIIHAAWETTPGTYWEALSNLDWLAATARMAAVFGDGGGKRFVQVGSCAEYDWSNGECVEGVTPDRPTTRYGKAKLAAFHAVQAAGHDRFEAVEGRVFFVYGPGEAAGRFVPTICRALLASKVPALGSGRQVRDFLHTADIGRALYMLALADGVTGTVNIAGGQPVSLDTIAQSLARRMKASDTGLGRRPDRPDEPERLTASAERLRSIGWAPTRTLDAGLAETLDWWRSQTEETHA